jgi:hypothetical protein
MVLVMARHLLAWAMYLKVITKVEKVEEACPGQHGMATWLPLVAGFGRRAACS